MAAAPLHTPATQHAAPAAAAPDVDPFRLVPWTILDFRLVDRRQTYQNKSGERTTNVLKVICGYKGNTLARFICSVTEIRREIAGEWKVSGYRLSMPWRRGDGEVMFSDDPATKAAMEAWELYAVREAMPAWLRRNTEALKILSGGATASTTTGAAVVELDLSTLTEERREAPQEVPSGT
jgi:hypothetical protein